MLVVDDNWGPDDGSNVAPRAGLAPSDLLTAAFRATEYLIGDIMNRLIYIVGLVVVVMAVLWFFGLR